MSKQITKSESNKEEKIVFIVIGIIVLVAVAILLTWYFTKDKDEEEDKKNPNPQVEPDKDKDKDKDNEKPSEPVVVVPVEFILPSNLLSEAFVGDSIEINPYVTVGGEKKLASVRIEQYVDGKWMNVVYVGDVFIPTTSGNYRLVYAYNGVVKYQTFTVKALEEPVEPKEWILPELIKFSVVGREETVVSSVYVIGQGNAEAQVKVQWLDEVWTDEEIVDGKFTPQVKGLYRFVYTFDGTTKYSEFTVFEEIIVASRDITELTPALKPDGEGSEIAAARYDVITGNLDSMEVFDTGNGIEIRVYSDLEMFNQDDNGHRPLKTPAGFVITFDDETQALLSESSIITSSTNGVYIDDFADQIALGFDVPNEILIWIDFEEFSYNEVVDIILNIDGESKIFTLVFKNYIFDITVSSEIDNEEADEEIEIVNNNIDKIEVNYSKFYLEITLIDPIMDPLDQTIGGKALIGLVVYYDGKTAESEIIKNDVTEAYYLPNIEELLLDDKEFLLWLDANEIGSGPYEINLTIDGNLVSFTVEII